MKNKETSMELPTAIEPVEIPFHDLLCVDEYRARHLGNEALTYLQGIVGEPNADLGVGVQWMPGAEMLEDSAQRRTAFIRFATDNTETCPIPYTERMGILAGEVNTITEFVSPDAYAPEVGAPPVIHEEAYRFYAVSDTAQGAIVVKERYDPEAEPDVQYISEVLSANQIAQLRDDLYRNESLAHL
jgi:hypothetical protein